MSERQFVPGIHAPWINRTIYRRALAASQRYALPEALPSRTLAQVAPASVAMAHRIVRRSVCSAGTLDAHGLWLTGWSLRVSPGTFPLSQAGEKLAWREQESKNG